MALSFKGGALCRQGNYPYKTFDYIIRMSSHCSVGCVLYVRH